MIRARLTRVTAAAALGLACAGPGSIHLDQLPASPIAALYRDERSALDRVDALKDLDARRRPSTQEGVVRVENLDAAFGGEPDVARRLREVQGHVSLIEPASGDASAVPGAPPGAQPLGWSPDRTRLLLSGAWRDGVQLFVWDRARGESEIATAGPGNHPMGCLGAGGRLVAVEASYTRAGWRGRLVATPPNGGGLRPLTAGPSDILPACSPTEPRVAYVTADERGGLAIAVIALDEPDAKPVVIARGGDPVFTPDGQWIVYAARTTQGQRIVRIRPDGSGRAPVGGGPDDESHPAVSPDGRFVAYVVTDTTRRERLRVRRFPDGSGDRPLVTTGDASAPVW